MVSLKNKADNTPLPNKSYCCAHSPECAIHQPPSDAKYVHCTCTEGAGYVRHKQRVPDPNLHPEHRTVQ